ncbi:MAG TPA: ferritin family protein [Acidobacteriota bacterium]|nr:ferritin family protein [Acidobacteriota bacterium]HQM64201.1 ferritin family protein [Acidobacteriota bacterium]
MDTSRAIDILKGAILAEMKGKAFYQHSASQSADETLKKVFETMALEENSHIDFLGRQVRSIKEKGQFEAARLDAKPEDFSDAVVNRVVQRRIAAAGFEAAAITAAMALEDGAVKFYSEQAQQAQSPAERELYQFLANWEKSHLNLLTDLDRQLKESVWNDQQFWPY